MNIRSSSYLVILSCFTVVTTVIACKPADTLLNNNQTNEEWQDITDSGLPRIEMVNLPSISQKVQLGPVPVEQETDSRRSVAIDKAKLAMDDEQETCPKLVELPVGSTKVVRKNEVMQDTYCDYYIYPKKDREYLLRIIRSISLPT